jgi:hypothetical protein
LWSGRSSERLVVTVGVEGEVAEQLSGGGVDDADVAVGDEHDDAGSGVFVAEADVVEPAAVAEGDAPGLVDDVVADPPVGVAGAEAGGPCSAVTARKVSTTMGPVTRRCAVTDRARRAWSSSHDRISQSSPVVSG